jgi:glycosyltransferase involved in cell wall biosynthesis
MNSASPDMAVLMPVYNPGPELTMTLDSIRRQSTPCRLYLVDDGSKSKPDYHALLKGMDYRLIELAQNQGITGALNAGLAEILKGAYAFVARVDNGDINTDDRFAVQKAYLESHPGLSVISSHVRYEYELTGLKIDVFNPETPEECARRLRYNAPLTHASIMFRMDFLRAFKSYSTAYPAAEDLAMEFWADANGYRMGNVPQLLYRTIEMSESISGGSRKKQLNSRLRLQWEYARWGNPHTWAGIARTLVLMVAPIGLLRRVKSTVRAMLGK